MQERVAAAERGLAREDGGRAVDAVAGFIDPVGFPSRGVEAVELRVVIAEDNIPILAVGRADEVGRAGHLVADGELPDLLPGLRVERVKHRLVRAEEDLALVDQWR